MQTLTISLASLAILAILLANGNAQDRLNRPSLDSPRVQARGPVPQADGLFDDNFGTAPATGPTFESPQPNQSARVLSTNQEAINQFAHALVLTATVPVATADLTTADQRPRLNAARVPQRTISLFCNQFELKSGGGDDESQAYQLQVAGDFFLQSNGLVIKGRAIQFKDGSVAIQAASVKSGDMSMESAQLTFPFVIERVNLSSGQKPVQTEVLAY